METTEEKIRNYLVTRSKGYKMKVTLIMVTMICCYSAMSQNATRTITITGSKFANPLIEKWASEYTRVNPGVVFKFVKSSSQNEQGDLKLTVNNGSSNDERSIENQVNIGRLAVLPVANEKNVGFDKQLKNGIKQEELKNLFLRPEADPVDLENEPRNKPLHTVYIQTPQSATAQVLINHFGNAASELDGVIVTGDDKYLIESVLEDSTGVTYSNLGLIYDLNNRAPLKGLKILPIDPDNSGRLKKEELVYDNLDQLISFLETSKVKTIPTEDISLNYNKNNNNPLVADFVNWVKISGQQFNHQLGFLKANEDKDPALTQK